MKIYNSTSSTKIPSIFDKIQDWCPFNFNKILTFTCREAPVDRETSNYYRLQFVLDQCPGASNTRTFKKHEKISGQSHAEKCAKRKTIRSLLLGFAQKTVQKERVWDTLLVYPKNYPCEF